ncbi:ROK family protein [Sinobaca sp. H24]|uniref:ROK family protein n=1 Tax=Sinobaca sp. H24 TaxID=2923376 RepID=UPI00207A06B7|nr:ROK family protein [Sinobaca sp. H24]
MSEEADTVLERVIKQIKKVIEAPDFSFSNMIGLGISSPGPINAEEGIILSPPHLPLWTNVNVVSIFEEQFQTTVSLERMQTACF